VQGVRCADVYRIDVGCGKEFLVAFEGLVNAVAVGKFNGIRLTAGGDCDDLGIGGMGYIACKRICDVAGADDAPTDFTHGVSTAPRDASARAGCRTDAGAVNAC
jgi:hypothetical protein